MKRICFSIMVLLTLPLFMSAQVALVPADTAGSPCDRHYMASLKVLVQSPERHPFSINADGGKVIFSPGNLQYCPARDEWRFALRQFDRVGNGKSIHAFGGAQATIYSPADIISKLKNGEDVAGLVMKITVTSSSTTQFSVSNVPTGSSITLNRADNTEITNIGTYDVTIVSLTAGSTNNSYTLVSKLYTDAGTSGSSQVFGVNDNVTTVFYDSIDYSTKDNTTASGYKEIKGVPCNNLLVSKSYDGWIDLFPWATSGHGRKVKDSLAMFFQPYDLNRTDLGNTYNTYGYGPSFNAGHGPGALSNHIDTASGTNRFFDWGYLNVIRQFNNCTHGENGAVHAKDSTMYRPGVWRTLTSEEWKYLLTTRTVGGNDSAFTYVRLQYTDNEADTVSGVLIYPDDFSFSEASVPIMPFGAKYGVTKIDIATFAALQEVGVAFLPGSRRIEISEANVLSIEEGNYGNKFAYWSSTAIAAKTAYNVNFSPMDGTITPLFNNFRFFPMAVRLVQDL